MSNVLLLATWCCCLAVSGPGQLGPAIEEPAPMNKDTPVDVPPIAVSSIRPVAFAEKDPMSILFSDDGASFRNVPVAWVIQMAFSPQPSVFNEDGLIVGYPGWTKSEHYDIEAKVDDEDVPKWKVLSPSQRRLALQPWLVTRFHLQFHHETRERPTYSLVVAKHGPKLNKAQAGKAGPGGMGHDDMDGNGDSTVTPGKIVLRGARLSVLANLLSSQGLNHTVLDKTGLTDTYDITLRWSPEDSGSSNATLPSLFTALQEQLGLKLEYNKNPIDVIVIDHIEKPSAN